MENLLNKIIESSMSYNDYKKLFESIIEKDPDQVEDEKEANLLRYTKLNWQRSSRIEKTYQPSSELIDKVKSISNKQIWMVITETWCGDSAQNLPYIAKIAELNDKIELRIVLRDEHPEIMDLYLTNGTRSIPKLVAFNENGDELFQWGPRPALAKQMVAEWKKEGLSKDEFIEKLHLWYGRNRGKELEKEFIQLIQD